MNQNMKYVKSHEWAAPFGENIRIGITLFAAKTLTDLVFIDLPQVGKQVVAEESFGEVESVKAVSELLAPISGEVVAINTAVQDDLAVLSNDPEGIGWLIEIRPTNPAEMESLMNKSDYDAFCETQMH
ncbi:MAG: glycine cleavage system protein GcvH [Thermoguttaceae bacterium]